MSPPIVYELTRPSNQRIMRIIAIVSSIFSPFMYVERLAAAKRSNGGTLFPQLTIDSYQVYKKCPAIARNITISIFYLFYLMFFYNNN